MRPSLATRARAPATYVDPDALRVGVTGAFGFGRTRTTGRPSTQNPGPSGYARTRPLRFSRWTTSFSQRTTAPTNPLLGSSTTRSCSASTCGVGFFWVRGWTRLSYGERGGTRPCSARQRRRPVSDTPERTVPLQGRRVGDGGVPLATRG